MSTRFGVATSQKIPRKWFRILLFTCILSSSICWVKVQWYNDVNSFIGLVIAWLGCKFSFTLSQFQKFLSHDLFIHFKDFWNQIRVVTSVTTKQVVERKSGWFWATRRCLNKNLTFSLVVFCSRAAIWITVFSSFVLLNVFYWTSFFNMFCETIPSHFWVVF